MDYNEVNLKIEEVKARIKPLQDELDFLYLYRKSVCPHDHLEYEESFTDRGYDYCDYFPARIICLDCDLSLKQGKYKTMEEHELFSKLYKKYFSKSNSSFILNNIN